ncbi:hypothetical protein ACFFU8_09415 [Chromobacterium piscinae]|uniref:hypothetical protein n=1 Tax=Chromobacterium piscinae TaxID=686831 RepID=UPI001E42EA77|nr:hypothetical protein [Chromobacterium piscinae]MCD5327877.1 hypothetical protein [Chromobacterium piscinae]
MHHDALKMDRIISGHGIAKTNSDDADWLRAVQEELAQLRKEVNAWRERFPDIKYRPQDDCVAPK